MATNNRRRDILSRLDKAYDGKMYLCTSALARQLGWGCNRPATLLNAHEVPRTKRGNRVEYAKEDIRDLLYQIENAS